MRLPMGKILGWGLPLAVVGLLVGLFIYGGPGTSPGEATGEIWTCSMHPQVRLDKPGPCPICGMKLIPVSQLKTEQVRTEERAKVEIEKVAYRELFKEVRTVGKIDYNERRVKTIAARTAGRVDRVYADFTGIEVKQNDHLVDVYSPALFSAQAELLRGLELYEATTGDRKFAEATLESARAKLQLLGILPEQIAELEKNRKEHTHLTIYAPLAGTIVEKMVREGQYVQEGDALYRIAELDPIWLYLDIYESDLGWVRYGQTVDVTVEAYPGEVFQGTVVFIDPFLNDQTRTVKVRVNLKNPERRLKPAMYASAIIRVRLRPDGTPEPTGLEGKYLCPMHPEVVKDGPGICTICEMKLERVPAPTQSKASKRGKDEHAGHAGMVPLNAAPAGRVLAIRASAVLDTGRRQITYRKNKQGAFELVDLKLGPRAEIKDERGQLVSYFPVTSGLKAGDEVVIRGGFMLDSQRQIEGMPSLLYAEGQSAANLHSGHGGMSPAPNSPSPAMPGHQH
jgi:membrane fusion protein, copper/silver efflux system